METRIFLQGSKSKSSTNTSSAVNVDLKGKRKLLPATDYAEVLSLYEQYSDERKKSNIIRLTCQVNPIASNVLFNQITEVVKDEGSDNVVHINYKKPNDHTIDGVKYKHKSIDFWSGHEETYYYSEFPEKDNFTVMPTHPTNSIRDTQLSNLGYTYHCGIDIFNNHLIRSNTFKTICGSGRDIGDFNTIADMMREVNGANVSENLYFPYDVYENKEMEVLLHLYKYEDLDTFEEATDKKLIKKYNGWVGFHNRSKIKSYEVFASGTELKIERPIMYLNGGDFVDMYPSRDLYSFVPKYNKFKKRIEKNWNYCITYPSSSYTPSNEDDEFSDIIETNDALNSLKALYFDENTRSDNGTTQLVIYGISKHGLRQGDYVNIYKTYETNLYWVVKTVGDYTQVVSKKYETESEAKDEKNILESYDGGNYGIQSQEGVLVNKLVLAEAEVSNVVDDYIFTVFNADTQISNMWVLLTKDERRSGGTFDSRVFKFLTDDKRYLNEVDAEGRPVSGNYYIVNDTYVNIDKKAQRISYKKTVGGIECDYYVRIFSRLPNFKYASGDTSNEYEIYKNDEEVLNEYKDIKYDFDSHISRLAFAQNIYADEIGEVVFTDDIDVSNIHDNLGRPLTSLYLTFVKNNKGYKEWYGYDYQTQTTWATTHINCDSVEYSHAFGRITCGIKTSDDAALSDSVKSINKINNVSGINYGYKIGGVINPSFRTYTTKCNGNTLTMNVKDEEVWYEIDKNFYGDLCYYDNYNAIEESISPILHRFNTAQRESSMSKSKDYYDAFLYDEIAYDDYDISSKFTIVSRTQNSCNAFKEGYYYEPHYEIPINTLAALKTIVPDFLNMREFRYVDKEDKVCTYRIVTSKQHFLTVGDKAMIYDTLQDKYYNLEVVSGDGDNYNIFTCRVFNDSMKYDNALGITLSNNGVEKTVKYISTNNSLGEVEISDYRLFKMDNLDVPSYAKVLKDGTCRVIWRDVIKNGFDTDNDSVEKYPFTNGALYINKRIDIHVRRQDPYDVYKLYDERDIEGNYLEIEGADNYIKDTDIEC